jgi:Thioredoxin-like domain
MHAQIASCCQQCCHRRRCLSCRPGFLDRLRIELRLQGVLQGLGLTSAVTGALLDTRADDQSDSLAELRLDLAPLKKVGSSTAVQQYSSTARWYCLRCCSGPLDLSAMGSLLLQLPSFLLWRIVLSTLWHFVAHSNSCQVSITTIQPPTPPATPATTAAAFMCTQLLWLNNPARDKQYANLPSSLQYLLNMYPGRLSPMAASVIHLVAIGDPTSREAVDLAGIMLRLHARCGVRDTAHVIFSAAVPAGLCSRLQHCSIFQLCTCPAEGSLLLPLLFKDNCTGSGGF